jgi:integrase
MARQTNIWKRTRTGRNGVIKNVWVASYYDSERTRRAKTFATEKAAKAFLVTTTYNVTQGVHTPEKGSLNVYEASQLWLERGRTEGLERNSLKAYETLVRLHIEPTIGSAKLATLSAPMVKAWCNRLLLESYGPDELQRSSRLARSCGQ